MPNRSEIVNDVVVLLKSGNVSDAVEKILKGNKSKPCKVAILASMVTESLMRDKDTQTLRFFVNKLEFYHTNNVHF